MHALASKLMSRISILIISAVVLSACGQGDGPKSIAGTPATPIPPSTGGPFDSGLLTNGDFEAGAAPWFGNAANVTLDGDNFVNFADVATAGQSFDVNLSQVFAITQGETYTLTFKARSNGTRTLLAGIGLNEDPWTNVAVTVNLTSAWQTFELDITATGFGIANSRVLFDMGADTGQVFIDDVSVVVAGSGGGGGATAIDPDSALFSTSGAADLVIPDDYAEVTPFGSGSIIDPFYADDSTYSPVLAVSSGTGYGANIAQIAYIGFTPGFAGAYETVDFKAKGLPNQVIFVKLFDNVDALRINLTSSAFSEALGDDWFQVSVPFASFVGVDQATGIVFESDNSSPSQFTMLLSDIGFSGVGDNPPPDPADPGTIPDAVVYATDPGVTVDLPPAGIDNFGSGAAFDGAFAGDADFNPAFQVTSGEGYGAGVHVGFVAFTGYTAGFASGYETFDFKAKVNAPGSAAVFEVKFIGGGDTSAVYDLATYSGSTDLGNGWYQVSVPIADFAATIAANDGFLLGPVGGQAGAFTMLLTDIGFSGSAATPGIVPEAVIYATDPGVTEDLAPAGIDNFGSGAAFDGAFAGDADYNPAFQVSSGEGYGAGVHVGFVAFTGYTAGFASGYGTFDFKAKVNAPGSAAAFEVKFIGGGDTSVVYDLTTYSGSTNLGNGWYQVSVPMTDFAANIAANDGLLLGPLGGQTGAFTMLLTDIGFSGTASGGGGACDVVGGQFAVNGDFEAGDLSCIETFPNGGTISADNTENNGGAWSAHVVAGPGNNPVVKFERRAVGTVMGSDIIDISFDMKGTAADGGVIFPEFISEGTGGAVVSNLLETIAAPTAGWTTYTYSPTAAADVSGGITFQIAVVCGGAATCVADVFIDNISMRIR